MNEQTEQTEQVGARPNRALLAVAMIAAISMGDVPGGPTPRRRRDEPPTAGEKPRRQRAEAQAPSSWKSRAASKRARQARRKNRR